MKFQIVLLLLVCQQIFAKPKCDSSLSLNGTCPCPDSVLDVPNLWVDTLDILVGHLDAHVSLEAKAANLVAVSAGAAVSMDDVDLLIREVSAQVKLIVRLGTVQKIIDRTLDSLDENPDLYISNTVGQSGVLATALNGNGNVRQRMVDQFARIVDRVVDQETGTVIRQNITASALDFRPYISRTTNSFGLSVITVKDPVSKKLVEIVVDGKGNVMSTRIIL